MKKSVAILTLVTAAFLAVVIAQEQKPLSVMRTAPLVNQWTTQPASFDVGLGSTMVAAPRGKRGKKWTLGTSYTSGSLVFSTNHTDRTYWNANADTNVYVATTNPDHLDGDVSDGSIVWRRVPTEWRVGLYVLNDSTNTVWLGFGHDAVVDLGISLAAGQGYYVDNETVQCAVYVISQVSTNEVKTQEM